MPPPLRLPLAIIERILFFALGGDEPLATPDTCVERIGPPRSTSHLLRVSKGFASLALPLYWRSITILSSTDWVSLWGVETGLLVGKAGQERADWVKELAFNVAPHARIPIDVEAVEEAFSDNKGGENHDASEFLIELDHGVFFPRLKHLCLFNAEPRPEPTGAQSNSRPYPSLRLASDNDAWLAAEEELWEAGADKRWRDYNRGGHRRGYHRGYSRDDEEEAREDWMVLDDDAFQLTQDRRRADMRRERRSTIHRILDIDNHRARAIHTFRTPTDSEALDLARGASPWFAPRIVVYPGLEEDSWKKLWKASLDPVSMYDFADVQPFARALLVSWLLDKYVDTALKRWRWVNDDGTTTPLVK